jgi:hypothetical protein
MGGQVTYHAIGDEDPEQRQNVRDAQQRWRLDIFVLHREEGGVSWLRHRSTSSYTAAPRSFALTSTSSGYT